jgi:hypothetical protein
MIPMMEWAKYHKIAILVLNPNTIKDKTSGNKIPVIDTPINHANFVWKTYVETSGFKNIKLIVNGEGGTLLKSLQLTFS